MDLSGIDLIGKQVGTNKPVVPTTEAPLEYSFQHTKESLPYKSVFEKAEAEQGIPKNLLHRVAAFESNFNPAAKSPKGAQGIMQIMPKEHPGVNPWKVSEAVPYAAKYLKSLYTKYGDWGTAVAAYNVGPGNYDKGIMPQETIDFRNKVVGAPPPIDTTPQGADFSGIDLIGKTAQPPASAPKPALAKPTNMTAPAGGWNEAGQPLNSLGVPYPFTTFSGAPQNNVAAFTPYMGMASVSALPKPTPQARGKLLKGMVSLPMTAINTAASFLSWPAPLAGGLVYYLQRLSETGDPDVAKRDADLLLQEMGKYMPRVPNTDIGRQQEEMLAAPLGWAKMAANWIADTTGLKQALPNIPGRVGKVIDYISDMASDFISAGMAIGGMTHGPGVVKAGAEFLHTKAAKADLKTTGKQVQQIKGTSTLTQDVERAKQRVEEIKLAETVGEAQLAQDLLNKELVNKNLSAQKAAEKAAKAPPTDMSGVDLIGKEETPEPTPVDLTNPTHEFVSKKGNRYVKVDEQWYTESGKPVKSKITLQAAEKGAKELGLPTPDEGTKIAEEAAAADKEAFDRELGMDLSEDNIVKFLTDRGYDDSQAKEMAKFEMESKDWGGLNFTDEAGEVKPVTNMAEYEKQFKEFETEGTTEEVPKREEPYTDLEEQTGEPIPHGLLDESSPFRNTDKEATAAMSKAFSEKMTAVRQNPEMLTQYFLNEFNRYLNGEEVDPVKARDSLSELAARADEAQMAFDTNADFEMWRDSVQEAAAWARRTDRSKIESTEPGIRLNTMIPLDEIPKAVRDAYSRIRSLWPNLHESIKFGEMYRNKKIFDETGFWLGKDGRWRYELDDSKIKIELPTVKDLGSYGSVKLRSIVRGVSADKLFQAVPELNDISVRVSDPGISSAGQYDSASKIIWTKSLSDKPTILHEVQHAINDLTGSQHPFLGSSPLTEAIRMSYETMTRALGEMRKVAKTNEVRSLIDENIDMFRRASELHNPNMSTMDYFMQNLLPKIKESEPSLWNDVYNSVISNEAPVERYMINQGEMEARLAEARRDMTAEERAKIPPWETLDRMLEGEKAIRSFGFGQIHFSRGYEKAGQKLYSGIPLDKITETIKKVTRGFHGTSDRYINPEKIVGSFLEPKSLKQIVENTLDDLKLTGKERDNAREKIYNYDYFDYARKGGEGTRPFEGPGEVYIAKKFEDAADYAQWAGEAYDNALIALGAFDKNPTGLAQTAKEAYERNRGATPFVLSVEAPGKLGKGDNVRNEPIKVTGVYNLEGTKLYSGIPLDEIIKMGQRAAKAMRKDEQGNEIKFGDAYRAIKKVLVRSTVERSGNIAQDLVDKLGDVGYAIKEQMYLQAGAHPKAINSLRQMKKEVYGGMDRIERTIINDLTVMARMVDIGKYKLPKQFTFPDGKSPAEAAVYMELFAHESVNGMRELDSNKAYEIMHKNPDGSIGGRVGAYFDWMRKPVEDAFKEGLISEQERDDLISHNYRKIRSVEDIFDRATEVKLGGKKITVNDSGIQRLQKGKKTDVYEANSELMALETFNRLYGRIYRNKANKMGLELARTDRENPFFRVKESKDDPKIPPEFAVNSVKVYENGKPINLFLSPDMAREWITSNAQTTMKYAQVVRFITGTPVVRTFATGINWAFALRNLPRDIMQIWFTARTYENGEYHSVYSPTAPIAGIQMTADIGRVFRDALFRKGRHNDYIDDGGGMDLLTTQGRMLEKKLKFNLRKMSITETTRPLENNVDRFFDFMGYAGTTSELMTRLAVRDRVIINEAKKQGITYEVASKDPIIRRKATFAARDYMDFHQGGDIVKAMDTAFPYLNARFVGTKGIVRALFKDQKAVSMYKLSQFAALVTALYIGNQALHPETMKELEGDQRTSGNLVFPLGDRFKFEDSTGRERYPFLVLPVDQGMAFFKTLFEGGVDLATGKPIDVQKITNGLRVTSPIDTVPLPPTISGALGYTINYNFWMGQDIRPQGQLFSYHIPKAITGAQYGGSEEEYTEGKTPQGLIDLGKYTGISPERFKYMAEQLITKDNIFASILGGVYEKAFGSLPSKQRQQTIAEILANTPVVRSFFKLTNPMSQYRSTIEESKEAAEVALFVQNNRLDSRADAYILDNTLTKGDLEENMRSYDDKDVYDRLKKRLKLHEQLANLPNRDFWVTLHGMTLEGRARAYVKIMDRATPEQFNELKMEEIRANKIESITSSDEFKREVMKIRRGQ